jgi:Ca2+-binding RTX toxin-like protein
MSFTSKLRWLRDLAWRPGRPRPCAPVRRVRPGVETLEDRLTPAAVFLPHFGPDADAGDGGNRLNSPYVYLIFWGSYWQGNGSPTASDIETQTQGMIDSGYFNLLTQYGTDGHPIYGGAVFDGSDPSDGFSKDDIKRVFNNQIDNGALPESDGTPNGNLPIYVVVTPPNRSSNENASGFHDRDSDFDFPFDFDEMPYAWVGGFGSNSQTQLDSYMSTLSHEIAEAMTDPGVGDGYLVSQPGNPFDNSTDEIGDFEPGGHTYGYRLNNGVEVQPIWSRADGAFVADDGNAQRVVLTPRYSGNNFLGNFDLTVNGDQFGFGTDDFVSIDTNASGGVRIDLNGEFFSFDAGQIHSITVNTGAGNNTVDLLANTVPVTLNGGGHDTVNLGSASLGVQAIQGHVTIENPPSFTTINVNDAADSGARNVTMGTFTPAGDTSFGFIVGLAPAEIDYEYADTSSVTVTTGTGTNVVDVLATGVTTNLVGSSSFTTVVVGNGSVQGILGTLNVENPPRFTTLVVDDSADVTARSVTMGTFTPAGDSDFGFISGLAPANINYEYADTTSVTVKTGNGGDVIDVLATGVATTLEGHGGATVNVGNAGSVQGILGRLTMDNPPNFYALTVDDSADAVGRTVTMGTVTFPGDTDPFGFIRGLAPAEIDYEYGDTNVVTVDGGLGNDTFTLTAAVTAPVLNLNGGGGNDTIRVNAAMAVNVDGGTRNDVVAFGPNGSTTGTVVGGDGTDTLVYTGRATGVTVNLAAGTATATGGIAGIENVVGTAHNDTLIGDGNDNVFTGGGGVDAVTGGGGNDTLVGPNSANAWVLTGANAGTLNGGSFTGVENLVGGSGTDTFVIRPSGSLTGLLNGGGGSADKVDFSAWTTAVTINLQAPLTETALHGGIAGVELLVGGSASDTLIGRNVATVWTLTGANAGTVGTLAFSSFENLTGGTSTDTFKFGSAGSVSGVVDGGGGTADRLDYTGRASAVTVNLQTGNATGVGVGFAGIEAMTGGSGSDRLIGTNADTVWALTGPDAGKAGTFSFTSVENLTGGTGADVFKFGAGATVSGKIVGGGGADWLDYAAYTTPVTVDLAAGKATGVDGGLSGGVTGLHNARGSATAANTLTGDSTGGVLVGGAGADNLTGGSGRSILIGGKGADTVKGGSADDIVIGGNTSFDANNAALMTLLAEWQSADSYATRISKIKSGTLPGGVKLVAGVTVANDGAADVLTGGAGQDWFFANLPQDTITDLAAGEQVN